jgi:methyl-accepting chemotaxis protein
MEISLDSVNAAVQSFRLKIMAAALVLMIPVAVFVYLFINRSVCIPLQHISRNLDDIADGDGDLTRRLPIVCKDGIGEISHAFNKLMVKLQGTIDEIKDGAEQLLATSTALASTAAQGAASSQMQSQEAYAMAAQAEIMTYSIDGIGNQADEVHGVTARSHELSVQGGEIIHRAVVEMNKITDAVNHSSNIIQELGRQSDQISTIIKVIKEVAEQTNLLALNAAIEAARAGEQGRGFAVVADEVRKLAERTSQSTQEITAMVEMIQAGTKQAISSMVAGVERVSEGAMLANQAGDAINRIKSESQLVVDRVRAISSSLHTQSNTNSENSRMVENIARLTDENSVAFRNTAELTGQLKTLADNLQVVVVRFRT